jgi:hypothetical protein
MSIRIKNVYSNMFKTNKGTNVHPRKIVIQTNVRAVASHTIHPSIHPSSLRTARANPPRVARRFHREHSFVRSLRFVRANTGKRDRARVVYIYVWIRFDRFFEISFGPRGHRKEPRGRVRRLRTYGLNARTTNTRGKKHACDGFCVSRETGTDGATMVGDRRRGGGARRCF